MARTETSAVSRSPEFLNRCFVLRLPTPLGSNATATASLQCNLFAMPSVEGQAGLMVAGNVSERLLRGNVSERLLRGEHVTLPVVLGGTDPFDGPPGAANLDLMSNLGVGAGTNANMYGRTGRELLLELMLLDAELTLPRDVYAMKAAVAANVASAASPLTNAKLMVLVSRAENLPTVRGEGGVDGPPSTFVALSSQKDASSRSPPQAVTRVVENSHNPMWGQMLQVKYSEGELSNEKLYISITNDLNSRLMLKCCVPLGHVVPRVHYNLQLMIPGGALGGSVVLYVTLCLTDCPAMEMRRVRNLTKGGGVTDVYAARLAASSAPLAQVARLANGSDVDDDSGEVFALWRVGPAIVNSQHGWQPQGNPPGHGSPHAGRPGGSPEAPRPPFGSTFALPGDGHSHIGAQIGGAHFPGGTPNMGASGALPSITSGQPFPSPPGSRSGSALGGAHSSALPPLSSALGGAHSSALPPLNSALGGAHSSALPPLSSALGGAQGSALPPHGSAVPPHGSALPSPLKHVKHGNKHVARKEAPSNAQDPPSARPSAGAAMYGALGESVERGGGMFPLESTSSHSIPIGADPGMVARTGSRGPGALAEGTESHSRPYSPRYHNMPKSGPGPIAEASESGKKSPSRTPSLPPTHPRSARYHNLPKSGPGPIAEASESGKKSARYHTLPKSGPGPIAEASESGKKSPSPHSQPLPTQVCQVCQVPQTLPKSSPGPIAEASESGKKSPSPHSHPYPPRSARYHTLPKSGPGPIAEASESGKKSPSAPASGQVTPSGVSVNLQPGSAANSNPGTPSRSSHQGPSTPSTQNPQGGQSTPDGLHNSVFGNPMDLASPMGSQTAGQQGSHQEPAGHYKPELGGHPPHGGKHMTSGGTPQHHLGPSPLSHGAGPLKLVQMPMPVDVSRLYTNVDAGSEDACNRAIMELSEEVATSKPGAVLDVMPVSILSGGRDHWPWPVDHTALLCCSASTSMSVKVELHHIAPGSETSVPIGYCELPTHALNPHGGVSGMYNQIPLCPATNGDTAMLSGMAWQGGAGGDDNGRKEEPQSLFETLVDDMVLKQLALERQWHRNWCMSIRATRAPQILENSANLSRDELVDRTEAALAAYARERRRNGELVHRLQQMHEEQVDMLDLQRRGRGTLAWYQELQAAHMSQ
eukprot:gene1244-32592_t